MIFVKEAILILVKISSQFTPIQVLTRSTALDLGHILLMKVMLGEGSCNEMLKVPVKSYPLTGSSVVKRGQLVH